MELCENVRNTEIAALRTSGNARKTERINGPFADYLGKEHHIRGSVQILHIFVHRKGRKGRNNKTRPKVIWPLLSMLINLRTQAFLSLFQSPFQDKDKKD